MELKEMIPEEKAAEVKHWLSKSSEGMLAKRNRNEYFAHAPKSIYPALALVVGRYSQPFGFEKL